MVHSTFRVVLILCLIGLLAACGSSSHVRTDARPSVSTSRQTPAAPARVLPAGSSHRVAKGDTLYGVAFRNGLDFRDLARWNGIAAPYTIFVGQNLRLTAPGSATASKPAAPSTSAPLASAPTTGRPVPAKPVATPPTGPAAAASAGAVTSAPPPVTPSAAVATTGPVAFRWPLDGALLQRFAVGDPARAGIEISSAAGATVRAAADGEVVYSGNGLMLYGELIIIKHTNSLLSAYARNGKRLVEEGAKVKAGQAIAQIGSARQSLHFEIRRDGKPVNPLDYLPRR